ncbi:hypothetical protein CBOM_00434 [Ceraceosorus bombacis]|uniref:Uncharacterized protein n=1 Tax=Ceraceosorus bombacis TaxID=401625 RepID=A0A0P1B9X7_9BASI|nr:hypothetical protein CBOM_00434 [Ceraceosorus bombacis]
MCCKRSRFVIARRTSRHEGAGWLRAKPSLSSGPTQGASLPRTVSLSNIFRRDGQNEEKGRRVRATRTPHSNRSEPFLSSDATKYHKIARLAPRPLLYRNSA